MAGNAGALTALAAVYWGLGSGPTALNVLNALTDFVPAIFAAQRAATPATDDQSAKDNFDFIIVGAGPAGSALALRLSERPDWNILLLEAGGEEVPVMTVPFFLGQFYDTDVNWHYVTTPQTHSCRAMYNESCDFPMGRALGGSTTINYMLNIRGNSKDFDNWAAMGNGGWSWEDVLPYFKKVEDVRIPGLRNSRVRGKDGQLRISYPAYKSGTSLLIARAEQEAGFPAAEDYNGEKQLGVGRIQTTTFRGARWSANSGYLRTARSRPNLFVRTRSLVTRVLFENGRAQGVRYVRNGITYEATAARELILSAGAVNTPAILMRSGVGPRHHLRDLGVPLKADLPVGNNLMDHTCFIGTYTTFNRSVSPGIPEILLNPQTHLQYFTSRIGPLTSSGPFEMLSFHELEGTPFYNPGWADVEIIYGSGSPMVNPRYTELFNVRRDFYDLYLKQIESKPTMMSCIFRLRPKSRGRVTLRSTDPMDPPLIDPRGLTDPEDVEVVLAGFRDYQKIISTPSMQRLGAQIVKTPVPGCESFEYDSDDFWRCAIVYFSLTIYHPSGTCKMGPSGDPTAVVTPDLKVIGIEGLRVVDASIMPLIVSGHLQMTSYMIGEKAADLIKQDNEI